MDGASAELSPSGPNGSDPVLVWHTAMSDLNRLVVLMLQVPTAATVEAMKAESIAPDFLSISEELGLEGSDIVGFEERFDAFRQSLIEDEDALRTLRREHTRLFSNPQGCAVPPYEGLYRAMKCGDGSVERGEVMLFVNPAAVDAERTYRESAGLGTDNSVPADSMTVELEYMAHLHESVSRAILDGDEAAMAESIEKMRAFRNDHVAKWAPEFFRDVRSAARNGLYSLAADLGILLCKLEESSLPAE